MFQRHIIEVEFFRHHEHFLQEGGHTFAGIKAQHIDGALIREKQTGNIAEQCALTCSVLCPAIRKYAPDCNCRSRPENTFRFRYEKCRFWTLIMFCVLVYYFNSTPKHKTVFVICAIFLEILFEMQAGVYFLTRKKPDGRNDVHCKPVFGRAHWLRKSVIKPHCHVLNSPALR